MRQIFIESILEAQSTMIGVPHWEHLAVHQFSGQHWGSKGYQKDIILPLSKDLYWLFNSRAFSLQIKWLIVNRFTLEIFVEFLPHPQLLTTGGSWYLVEREAEAYLML